jgi:hypothetical protein
VSEWLLFNANFQWGDAICLILATILRWSYGNWIYNYLCNQCPITTKVVSLNAAHGQVYSIQHYVIKFVSDLRQVGDFFWVLPVSSTNKIDRYDITEILLKVALKTITLILNKLMQRHNIWQSTLRLLFKYVYKLE